MCKALMKVLKSYNNVPVIILATTENELFRQNSGNQPSPPARYKRSFKGRFWGNWDRKPNGCKGNIFFSVAAAVVPEIIDCLV